MDIEDEASAGPPKTVSGFRKFYLAALFACLGQVGMGMAMGYSSPALLSMNEPNSGFEEVTEETKSWIGSIMAIGALVGGIVGGPFADRFGRRTLLMCSVVPFTAGWITVAYSGTFWPCMVGRVLTGFCCGCVSLAVPVYVSETAPADVRGFLGSCMQLSSFTGVLLVYGLGIACNWSLLALLSGILPVLCAVTMFFMPESPRWLVMKGQRSRAIDGIVFLNGDSVDAEQECRDMEESLAKQPKGNLTFKEVTQRAVLWPLGLSLALMVFQQWCGFNGVMFFAGDVFKSSGYDSISPYVSPIILAACQFGGTFISAFIIDRAGRKALLQVSGVVMTIGLTALGVILLLKDQKGADGAEFIKTYGWVTVASLSIYVAAFAMGYGPIAWLMMGELLPARVRGPASAIATAFNWTNAFLVTKTFATMQTGMTTHGAYFFYDGVCVLSCVFVFFLLPETKGKSLEDIEKLFSSKPRRSSQVENGATNSGVTIKD